MNKEQRLQVYNKYNGHCAYCGKEIDYKDMQIDHIIPQYKGKLQGKTTEELNSFDNYNPSCRSCNLRKANFSLEQFREEIKSQAKREMQRFQSRMSLAYGLIEYYPNREVVFYFEKENGKYK